MLATHPLERELDDFLLGKLTGPDHAHIESHLGECSACLATASAKASADTFVALLVAADTRVTAERSANVTPIPDATPSAFRSTLDFPCALDKAVGPRPTARTRQSSAVSPDPTHRPRWHGNGLAGRAFGSWARGRGKGHPARVVGPSQRLRAVPARNEVGGAPHPSKHRRGLRCRRGQRQLLPGDGVRPGMPWPRHPMSPGCIFAWVGN
jgi:anti-sigma factor RsiW